MEPVIAAAIGLLTGVAITQLSAWNQQRLETRKQLASQTIDCVQEIISALTENGIALREVQRAGTDQSGSGDRVRWQERVITSSLRYEQAKVRLVALASSEVLRTLAIPEQDGGFEGSNRKHQQALMAVLERLRKELGAEKLDAKTRSDAHTLVFGAVKK